MRKILVLATVAALAVSGLAYAASAVTNIYVIKAQVKPSSSGTVAKPVPVSSSLEWDVSSEPAGQRPNAVRGYKISYSGITENTTKFTGCGTSALSGASASPAACPKGSTIGSGYLILELGPTGETTASYNATCRAEVTLFNGGNHNLTLFVYEGAQVAGQPVPCPLPGKHAAINVNIVHAKSGISETFSVPLDLLHPAAGYDAAVTKGVIRVASKSMHVARKVNGKTVSSVLGLFDSVSCPANHQRQIAISFTDVSGVGRTRTTLVPCS